MLQLIPDVPPNRAGDEVCHLQEGIDGALGHETSFYGNGVAADIERQAREMLLDMLREANGLLKHHHYAARHLP